MVYRAICERLKTIGSVLDASECFVQMVNELEVEMTSDGEQKGWIASEWSSMLLETAW